MLADNILYFRKNNPDLLRWLRDEELHQKERTTTLEQSKCGKNTLKIIKEGREYYLHSKYNPVREAKTIIEHLTEENNINNEQHVIFWGLGLGYHLETFVECYPEVEFSIFEPSPDIFLEFLNTRSIEKLSGKCLKLVQCGNTSEKITIFFNEFLNNTNKEIIICELPAYQQVFQSERAQFLEELKTLSKIKRASMATNYVFKKRWVLNSVVNFSEVLKTPNILLIPREVFSDQSAILVAAGPSLDLEIDNLKRIKEEQSAYLFSVGSSINTLIENGIYPDAMCTYDPQGINQAVFNKIYEKEITSIPMIFGTSVGFETLERYNGSKFHMITSQDTVSQYFLREKTGIALQTVTDAPSIAVMTLELLQKLEFKEIILVGQNLAYSDDSYYASGIDYGPKVDEKKLDDLIEVMGVNGKNIKTNDNLNRMRKDLEVRISLSKIPVINTTIGGAAIEGTVFKSLSAVIKENLQTTFKINALQYSEKSSVYDCTYLIHRFQNMKNSYETYKEILVEIKQLLVKTDELIRNKNLKQSEAMYDKLDKLLGKFEANDFARVFAIPMNRVEHELLAVNLHRIKRQKKGLDRIKERIAYLDRFINQLLNAQDTDQKIMMNLEKSIMEQSNE